ncbi:hypothetical protein ACFL47_04290 [Candidatus Latescibacterota bacterium]
MKPSHIVLISALMLISFIPTTVIAEKLPEGTARITWHGIENCIRLSNGETVVVLDPNTGGRVVEYSLKGKDSLYHAPEKPREGHAVFIPDAGRFDIGPEMKAPKRGPLWDGKWEADVTGPRSARLTSVRDTESTGVQLVRDFTLDSTSSHLSCTQTIINISPTTRRYHHWSRTLATGHGICIVPLTPELSRFPRGYILYGPGGALIYRHEPHPGIRVRDNFLEVIDTPPSPKFGIDSYAGWLGYITRDDLLFVKRFPTYPDRRYGEVAAYTISLWYYKDDTCELEPIGPTEVLKPGDRASYTEDWWLLPYDYPQDKQVDLVAFETYVDEKAR